MMEGILHAPFWQSWGLLIARIIIAGVFGMATFFKFSGMADTAAYIAAAGIPFSLPLAWIAAIFELALVIAFLTGAGPRLPIRSASRRSASFRCGCSTASASS